MTREEMIAVMKNEKECVARAACGFCDRECFDCDLVMEDTNLLAAYDEVITALERERWIPCKEQLPEANGRYIVCYEDAATFLDYFNGKWFFPLAEHAMAYEEIGTLIAWRPLPEPPKEAGDG